jgi:hypothetical protein
MAYTVKQLSKLSGVTVRTLHYSFDKELIMSKTFILILFFLQGSSVVIVGRGPMDLATAIEAR